MSSPESKRLLRFMALVCVVLPLGFSATLYLITRFAWSDSEGQKLSLKLATITYGAMAGLLSLPMMIGDLSVKVKEEFLSEIFTRWIFIFVVNTIILYILISLIRH